MEQRSTQLARIREEDVNYLKSTRFECGFQVLWARGSSSTSTSSASGAAAGPTSTSSASAAAATGTGVAASRPGLPWCSTGVRCVISATAIDCAEVYACPS